MTDYILSGWGNKDLWALNNSIWTPYGGYDCLGTGDGISGGYGEREFTDIINNDWEFTIAKAVTSTLLNPRGIDIQIFLDGDPKPIIFRFCYDDPEGYNKFYIIYDGDIKDSHTIPEDEYNYTSEIRRVDSIYYYSSYNLSFNYGSTIKPIKLRFATSEKNYKTYWYNLLWYYTIIEDEDYAFVT